MTSSADGKPETGNGQRPALRLAPLAFAALMAAFAALFHFYGSEHLDSLGGGSSVFRWLFIQYHWPDMQFTWVMPLVALYAVWDGRRALAAARGRPSLWGVLFVAASIMLHVLAFRAEQPRISLFAMAFCVWGSCWALWGRRVAYRLLFPLGYVLLSFLCYHITHYTTSLQVFASKLSVFFLRGFGLDASNSGSVIRVVLANDPANPLVFNVADGCSGLRSLVVLSALAAPYAYFRIRGNLRAWILFAMSLPLAIFTNVLRISSLTLFAHLFGRDLSMQVYHDPAGFLVFFIAILLLQATGAFLERDWRAVLRRLRARLRRRGAPGDDEADPTTEAPTVPSGEASSASEAPASPPPPAAPRRFLLAWAVLLAFTGAAAATLARPRHFKGNPEAPVDFALPAELGAFTGDEMVFCTNDQCFRDYRRGEFPADADVASLLCPVCSNALDTIGIGERKLLPPGTPVVRRVYDAKDMPQVNVTAVFTGLDRSAIHRPQHCLRAQGHEIVDEHDHEVVLPDGQRRTLHVLDTIRRYKNESGRTVTAGYIYAYWYFNPECELSDNLHRIIRTGLDSVLRSYRPRWAYISIGLACNPDDRAPAYEVIDDFVTRLAPVIATYQARTKAAENEP